MAGGGRDIGGWAGWCCGNVAESGGDEMEEEDAGEMDGCLSFWARENEKSEISRKMLPVCQTGISSKKKLVIVLLHVCAPQSSDCSWWQMITFYSTRWVFKQPHMNFYHKQFIKSQIYINWLSVCWLASLSAFVSCSSWQAALDRMLWAFQLFFSYSYFPLQVPCTNYSHLKDEKRCFVPDLAASWFLSAVPGQVKTFQQNNNNPAK